MYVGGGQAEGPLRATQRAGYEGRLYAVNPRRDHLAGVPTVPSLSDLPGIPDAALIALSPTRAIEAVTALSAMGAGGATVISGGFAEIGPEGRQIQDDLVAAAGDMAILGPNCMGALNQFEGAAVWGTDNHVHRQNGKAAALISQSGALLFGITNVERNFPLGYAISTGNQAVVDTPDCIHAVLDDDRVSSIGVYLEGLADGARLAAALERAHQAGVPVVVLKAGQTGVGAQIAISHTAAMVVEDDIWSAFVARYGVLTADSPKQLVETVKLLAINGVPDGPRLTAISFSGGLNGLIAAQAPRLGLRLVQPEEEVAATLKAELPLEAPIRNPLDLNLPFASTTGIDMTDTPDLADIITRLGTGAADALAFFVDIPLQDEKQLGLEWTHAIDATVEAGRRLGVPTSIVGILPEGLPSEWQTKTQRKGVASLLGFEAGLHALSVAARAGAVRERVQHRGWPHPLHEGLPESPTTRALNEVEGKELLSSAGVPVPAGQVSQPHEAAVTAKRVGYPVAVKVVDAAIAHKSKAGGVVLGAENAEDIEDAVSAIVESIAGVKQLLIEPMAPDGATEFIVGTRRSRSMGLGIMLGRGGVDVETKTHFATLLTPLDEHELDVAFEFLMVESREMRQALHETMTAVVSLITGQVESVEVNPLLVWPDGSRVAVDALVVKRSG